MRLVCVAMMLAAASDAAADPPRRSRRLEALQLGWMHVLDEERADAAMLSIETGTVYDPGVGVAGLLRAGIFHGSRYSNTYARDLDEDRIDIFVGPRAYVEAVPERVLLGLGAGVLISMGEVIEDAPQGQPFVEAYAGLRVVGSAHRELEVGALGGLALDEDRYWLGLSIGMRWSAR